jgi:MoxR-like ATPase
MSDERDGRRASSADEAKQRRRPRPIPGLVLVFADRRPTLRVFRADSGTFELGRVELAVSDVLDGMISRKHVRVSFDVEFQFEDLSSLNGTFVGGRRISGEAHTPAGTTLRVGGAVLLAVADVLPFEEYGAGPRDGLVSGVALRRVMAGVLETKDPALASLLIEGEPGTGKELAARAFHAAGPVPNGPFCVVPCTQLPRERIEAAIFGTTRGGAGSSGAGYVHAAHGGTLYLDEVSELSTDVQGRLLSLLEIREVMRVGSSEREPVDLRVYAASFRHLRDEVAGGRFRQDLYSKLARPELRLPALRERPEEIPWHVQQVLEGRAPAGEQHLFASGSFIEACLLRPWPGNVRELRTEVERAAAALAVDGPIALTAEDLSPAAGRPVPALKAVPRFPEDDVAKALTAEAGNVLGAARRLGVHRNKVRRWLERHHVDAGAFKRRSSL